MIPHRATKEERCKKSENHNEHAWHGYKRDTTNCNLWELNCIKMFTFHTLHFSVSNERESSSTYELCNKIGKNKNQKQID